MEFILFILFCYFIYLIFNPKKLKEVVSIIKLGIEKKRIESDNYTKSVIKELSDNNQRRYYKKPIEKSKIKHGHTERVWERKGYRVKQGETYAYIYYGNKVYTREQVYKKKNFSIKKTYKQQEDFDDIKWQKEMKDIIGHDQSW